MNARDNSIKINEKKVGSVGVVWLVVYGLLLIAFMLFTLMRIYIVSVPLAVLMVVLFAISVRENLEVYSIDFKYAVVILLVISMGVISALTLR